MPNIVIIGSGNLATHLSLALHRAGINISQVYSRTLANATTLAQKIGASATDSLSAVRRDADIYIISVKDDALPGIVASLSDIPQESVIMHTAGSVPMDALAASPAHKAVLYPMQTFSKNREVDFNEIPCFIEASDSVAHNIVSHLANSISSKVVEMDSEKRRSLHLAAVFACNLTNHCYRLAEKVLEEKDINFEYFIPIINETARKVSSLSPREAQTGPMVRGDQNVMNAQLALINDETTRNIYRLMAESIHRDANSK